MALGIIGVLLIIIFLLAIIVIRQRQGTIEQRHNKNGFRNLLDDSPLGVRIVTEEGETIYANRALLDSYGYDTIEELNTTPVEKRYTPESYTEFQIRREKRKQGDYVPPTYEVNIVRRDSEVRILQVYRKVIVWNGVEQFQVVYHDITDSKRAEKKLRTSSELMRNFAGRLQAVREEERKQIAREIHDELGGALTGLKIECSFLARSLPVIENELVRTSLLNGMNSLMQCIDSTIQTVRRIAMELRPGVLDDLGLIAATEWLINDFQKRTAIRCEWISSVEHIDLDPDLSTALFRIIQEALTNIARHSGATEIRIHLRTYENSIIVEVEDNGKGIDHEKDTSSKSLGLLGMRERALTFGGQVTVKGTPRVGTTVTIEVPLAPR
ncbi:MAG TPA: PAS domain-containing sensor histidine kinase [Syntrophales bacterium]|nr:PAS domain-containing sensor histidine kinase [Syntrophales bacterium]HPQ42968.1 PAS domain-containing sensor histidine kinase [Syntrophales bacterium]